MASFAGPLRRYALALLLLAAPFLLPGAGFLAYVGPHKLGPAVWSSWWMQNLLMPHQVYLLMAMSVVLALAMNQLRVTSDELRISGEDAGRHANS